MATNTNSNFPTAKQVPDHSIMDLHGRQCYLGNVYIGDIDTVSVSSASEVPVYYISCPSVATNATTSVFVSDINLNAQGSSDVITFRIYVNPTGVSGGSSVSLNNARPASTSTSIAVAKKSPSVSTKGTLMYTVVVGFDAQSLKAPLIILDPGQSMLITAQTAANAVGVVCSNHYEL